MRPSSLRFAEAPAGTVVTQVGEPGDSFFIIIDGAVAVRTAVGGDRQRYGLVMSLVASAVTEFETGRITGGRRTLGPSRPSKDASGGGSRS